MRKLVLGLLGACCLTALGTQATMAAGLTIGVVQLEGDTYFTNVSRGARQANAGGSVIVENSNADAGQEAKALDDLTARQVDAIVISPIDAKGSIAGIRRAARAGIPVICYNTCIDDADAKKYVKAFVLSDQAGMGRRTGAFAVRYLAKNRNKATFGVVQCDSFDICRQRKQAFFKSLDDAAAKYKVVADQEAYVVDKAVPIAENMLTASPGIDVLWAANDGGTVGLVKAVQSAGKTGKVVVFGSDMTPQLGHYMLDKDPILLTTTGQDGLATGAEAVDLARKLKAGTPIGDFVQIVPVVNYSVDDPAKIQKYLDDNK